MEHDAIKKIFDCVVTYRPVTSPNVTVIACDRDDVKILIDDGKTTMPVKIVIGNHGTVITDVGICFDSVNSFVNDFWAINWLELKQG